MTLGEIILKLRSVPSDRVVKLGWDSCHSWRGDYSELAFNPYKNATVGDMLRVAENALGATFGGWKGGEYVMTADTQCYLAKPGEYGGPDDLITERALAYMLEDVVK